MLYAAQHPARGQVPVPNLVRAEHRQYGKEAGGPDLLLAVNSDRSWGWIHMWPPVPSMPVSMPLLSSYSEQRLSKRAVG